MQQLGLLFGGNGGAVYCLAVVWQGDVRPRSGGFGGVGASGAAGSGLEFISN